MQERQQVYQLLRDHIATDRYTVMAGDINAAYFAAHRSNDVLTPSDQAHQKLLKKDLHLEPTDIDTSTDSRAHTCYFESHDRTHSRIDDFAKRNHLSHHIVSFNLTKT